MEGLLFFFTSLESSSSFHIVYGKTKGIENLNLELNKGEIFGLIGPNGAGKSTTIRSIMNLLNKNEGKYLLMEKN
ncbi:MAG: ATP-binding cassette domain-containing protein, partial [Agathobacter sp.]